MKGFYFKSKKSKNKMKENTAGKPSTEKKNAAKGECVLNCTKSVKLTDIVSLLCNRLFHVQCVQHHHKIHILEE
jgi:hypothetical protein